jgi:hypothetical protein
MLMTLQVALSLTFVVGASMFLRSFVALAHLDPGFDQHAVLVVNVTAGQSRVGLSADVREAVLDAVRATPGVKSAAWSRLAPLNHAGLRVLIANPPRHLRRQFDAHRCCGKSLIGTVLMRFGVHQHARADSISKRAPSTTRTSLPLESIIYSHESAAETRIL